MKQGQTQLLGIIDITREGARVERERAIQCTIFGISDSFAGMIQEGQDQTADRSIPPQTIMKPMMERRMPTSELRSRLPISARLRAAKSAEEQTMRNLLPKDEEKKRTYAIRAMNCVELIAKGVHLARFLLYSAMMMPADVMRELPPEKCLIRHTLMATKKAVDFFLSKMQLYDASRSVWLFACSNLQSLTSSYKIPSTSSSRYSCCTHSLAFSRFSRAIHSEGVSMPITASSADCSSARMAVTDSRNLHAYSPNSSSKMMTVTTPAIFPNPKNVPVIERSCFGEISLRQMGAMDTQQPMQIPYRNLPMKRVIGVVICTMRIEITSTGRAKCMPASRVICVISVFASSEPKRPPKGMIAMSNPCKR